MRAITVNEYGAAPALTEVPDPHPGPGQVLIKVEAAGMNPMDRSMAAGAWKEQMPGSFPFVLGADLAGVVEAIGEGADRFKVGEEVFGQLIVAPLGSAGTYAEHVAVTENAPLARRPEGLDPIVAAALPTAGVTALQIVESLGQLTGKTILMVGAAGGVGSFAMQLAAQAGAHVIAVARADGRYNRMLRAIARLDLLILDDWGPDQARCRAAPRSPGNHRGPLRIAIDDRHQPTARRRLVRDHRQPDHRGGGARSPRP